MADRADAAEGIEGAWAPGGARALWAALAAALMGCGRGPDPAAGALPPVQGALLADAPGEAARSGGAGESLALDQLPPDLLERWGLARNPAPTGHRSRHGAPPPAALPPQALELGFEDLLLAGWSPRALLEPEREGEPPWTAAVSAARGGLVALAGYPLAFESGSGGTTALWLTAAPPGCCFGVLAGLDAQVEVELDPPGPRQLSPLEPRWFVGRFEAGEARDAYGFVSSLYRLRGARLLPD